MNICQLLFVRMKQMITNLQNVIFICHFIFYSFYVKMSFVVILQSMYCYILCRYCVINSYSFTCLGTCGYENNLHYKYKFLQNYILRYS